MRAAIRSLGVIVLALASTVVVAVAWTTAAAVQLLATALIMGGTQHPLTPADPDSYTLPYMSNAILGYINPAAAAGTGTGGEPIPTVAAGDPRYAVNYPAEFFPVFGRQTMDASVGRGRAALNGCIRGTPACAYNPGVSDPATPPNPADEFVVFGYSQSSIVASLVKRDLLANPDTIPDVSFFLLANPMRPNGGILARAIDGLTIPILGVTFHGATPTDSCERGKCLETVDLAAQYDGLGGDAPASLTNVLAMLNAVAGYVYLHGNLQYQDFDDAVYQGSHGDTDYYLVPSKRLPILMPFQSFIPSPILTALDAPLRVAIEAAYARDVNPGIATKVGLLPFRDPIATIVNILRAIPVGIDDALAEFTNNESFRPLGTIPATSPFGVGGPQLPPAPSEEDAVTVQRVGDDGAGDDAVARTREDEEPVVDQEPVEEEPVVEEEEEPVVAEDDDPPPLTDPGKPEVRGPIQFESRGPADSPETTDTTDTGTATSEPKADDAGSDAGPGGDADAGADAAA